MHTAGSRIAVYTPTGACWRPESPHENQAHISTKNAARLVWDQSLICMAPRSHGQYCTAAIGFLKPLPNARLLRFPQDPNSTTSAS